MSDSGKKGQRFKMSTNGTGTPKDKSKNKGDVDLNNTKRGVWLVKVGNVYEKYGFELSGMEWN